MEETAFELLEKIAQATNREVVKHEKLSPIKAFQKIPHSTRWIAIKDQEKGTFFSYDATSNAVHAHNYISGNIIPVRLKKDFSLYIAPKDILDKLNIFKKYAKTEVQELDRNYVIESNDMYMVARLLQDGMLQHKLEEACKTLSALRIELNRYDLNHIPLFEGETLLSVHRHDWTFDPEHIEQMFDLGKLFYDRLQELGWIE